MTDPKFTGSTRDFFFGGGRRMDECDTLVRTRAATCATLKNPIGVVVDSANNSVLKIPSIVCSEKAKFLL